MEKQITYLTILKFAEEIRKIVINKNNSDSYVKEIISLLRKFNRENNQTVIIITHDERIALSADRVITIEDGQITKDGARN